MRNRPSTKLSSADMPATGNSELRRVIRERDELQTLLDKFERHMAEVWLICCHFYGISLFCAGSKMILWPSSAPIKYHHPLMLT